MPWYAKFLLLPLRISRYLPHLGTRLILHGFVQINDCWFTSSEKRPALISLKGIVVLYDGL